MSKWHGLALLLGMVLLLGSCAAQRVEGIDALAIQDTDAEASATKAETMDSNMVLTVNGTEVAVRWEQNETVEELLTLARENPVTVHTMNYGGFEQVGSLPQGLSRSDVQMTTEPGDIVLYSGNQLVLFFGANSWSYTKLGHMELPTESLKALLDGDAAVIEISVKN